MKKKISIIILALLLCGTIIFTSCKKEDPPAAATSIELVSGGSQTGVVGNDLANPVVIIVKDQSGNAFAGATLTFTANDGSVSPASASTNSSGNTSVTWTLGATAGSQTLTVSGVGTPITVNATAGALVASSIELVSGGDQSAMTETTLENPVVVVVKDQYGDVFAGTTVSFSVTDGGSISVASTVADASGNASVSWTLGDTEGTQTLTVTGTGTPLSVTATGTHRPVIGDFFQGGVVFYVDGDHGLVCTVNDLDYSGAWGCEGDSITGANGTVIGTGNQNTIDIVAGCNDPGTAAEVCANLELGGYSDWFLPSIDELAEIYENRVTINATSDEHEGEAIINGYYWSSSEDSNDNAWTMDFSDSYPYSGLKDTPYVPIRAIRTF